MTLIKAAAVVTPTAVLKDAYVVVDGQTIVEVGAGSAPGKADFEFAGTLLPGFVDIHCHGGGGSSFDSADGIAKAADFHLKNGTTSLVASLVSAAIPDQVAQLKALVPFVAKGLLVGAHLEGPFLAHAMCGAQNPAVLKSPTGADITALLDAAPGTLKMVTLAPELDGVLDAIAQLTAAGVVAAIGHSDATAEQARPAVDAGATVVTHLFNAMRRSHHRESTLSDMALIDDRLYAEVIADGIHISAIALQLAADSKAERLIAVTDAVVAAGMPDGDYQLGGLAVTVSNSTAHLTGTTTLAGSTLTMAQAFTNLMRLAHLDLVAAAHACATAPAAALNLEQVGAIEKGKRADFVFWQDGVKSVWQAGQAI